MPTRLSLVLCAIALSTSPIAASAQSDAVSDLLGRIDALRVQNGLAPLELDDQLSAAAQRHSRDMANTGSVDHTGSDGSTPEQRIHESGYRPSFSAWGENIYGGGIATVDDAWGFWTTSPIHRNNLLSARYREIGIGVATSDKGTYYTLNFGARPGVLPFFVNQGGAVSDRNVTLTLSSEETVSSGSDGRMGEVVEVRIGEGEDAGGAAWHAWARSLPFTLSNVSGPHRITVEYRDARGVTASYFRLVTLIGAQLQATATIRPTIQPSIPPATRLSNTPTIRPSNTPTRLPSNIPTIPPTNTHTPAPTATNTRETAVSAAPSKTSTLSPAVQPTNHPTIRPTATPVLEAAITPTPHSPLEVLIARGWSDAPTDWLGLIAGLQVVAMVIVVFVVARRLMKS